MADRIEDDAELLAGFASRRVPSDFYTAQIHRQDNTSVTATFSINVQSKQPQPIKHRQLDSDRGDAVSI